MKRRAKIFNTSGKFPTLGDLCYYALTDEVFAITSKGGFFDDFVEGFIFVEMQKVGKSADFNEKQWEQIRVNKFCFEFILEEEEKVVDNT